LLSRRKVNEEGKMQSGKILPTVRQFFSAPKPTGARRDPDSQAGQERSPEREATEEEAQRAAELLADSDEFQKNGLSVRVEPFQGRSVLVVLDKAGSRLRTIKGAEIVRILLAMGTHGSPRQGRILDRRI
jgi:hypothetical protein